MPNKNRLTLFAKFSVFAKIFAKKTCVHVVVDYADTRFSNFVIEYIRKNEKVRDKTVFACSYGAQVESFKKIKKMIENSRDTVSLSTRRNFLLFRKSGKFRFFFKYRYVPVLLTPAALRCDFGYGPCIVAFNYYKN